MPAGDVITARRWERQVLSPGNAALLVLIAPASSNAELPTTFSEIVVTVQKQQDTADARPTRAMS